MASTPPSQPSSMRVTNPRYPSVSLGEALATVRRLYQAAHLRQLSRLEIARLLGYTTLNGASITAIANMTRYGLLQGRGEQIRVSDDAVVALVEPEGSLDRAAVIRRLALTPELFKELAGESGGAPLPEAVVRVRLERKRFTAQAAEAASSAFRETMELVAAAESTYTPSQVSDDSSDSGGSMQDQPAVSGAAPSVAPMAFAKPPAQGFRQDVFALSEGDVVLRWPETLSPESYGDFKGWLELVLRKVARSAGVKDEG